MSSKTTRAISQTFERVIGKGDYRKVATTDGEHGDGDGEEAGDGNPLLPTHARTPPPPTPPAPAPTPPPAAPAPARTSTTPKDANWPFPWEEDSPKGILTKIVGALLGVATLVVVVMLFLSLLVCIFGVRLCGLLTTLD